MRSILGMDDFEKFGNVAGIDPRDFTAQFLAEVAQVPELDSADLLGMGDTALQQIAHSWIAETGGVFQRFLSESSAFDAIHQGYMAEFSALLDGAGTILSEVYAPVFPALEGPFKNLTDMRSLAGIDDLLASNRDLLNAMADSVVGGLGSNFVDMLTDGHHTGAFFENLPDILELHRRAEEELEQVISVLHGAGYSLLNHWLLSSLFRLVGIDQVDNRVRSAVVTNRLLGITRRQGFFDEIRLRFSESSVLSRRWRVIEQALIAHRNRHYAISIPTLLAQIEGIFTDALVLKGTVKQDNGKLYARDPSGALKLNKNGDPIELHGLRLKVKHSDLQDEPLLHDLARFFTDYLVKGRNDILHGRIVDYDKAKLSVQLLLYTHLLAVEFADYEREC